MGKMSLSFYKNKRVLITGNTGFKGAWLSRILIMAGAKVYGYSLKPPTKPSLFELIKLKDQMKTVIADIRDLSAVKKTVRKVRPEIVFHMAAQPLVRESYADPVTTYATNVMGTVNILEACRNVSSIRSVVNVTTDKVYQNMEWERGYKETDVLNGHDPYSNSKSCSELVTSSYLKAFYNKADSPALSTARSGNVIGGGDFSKDRIIPDCIRAAAAKTKMVIRNPKAVRPYQHVMDCLSGYLVLARRQYDKKFSGAYNFGPDRTDLVNNQQLVELFCKSWGNGLKSECRPDGGPHEAHLLILDTAKAKKVLGWKPAMNVKKAVALTAEWSRVYLAKGNTARCMDEQIKEFFGE